MINLKALENEPRLVVTAMLRPVQTDRFQPTGFPDLGPATYTLYDGTPMLLVESAQSMANRAEAACWDEVRRTLAKPLDGLPYIHVDIVSEGGRATMTASVLEAHRLNSPYVLQGERDGRKFEEVFLETVGYQAGEPVDRQAFVRAVFRYDPAALLHGLFMSNVGDGRMRLARVMSSFIEARNVRQAPSGGVKNDRINPSGDAAKGFGNVPFTRTEYTAERITAFLNLDLRQLRSFGLPTEATEVLMLLALYKFRKLLGDQLRLRTACDLEVVELSARSPQGFALPALGEVEAALPGAIRACRQHFADPPVTHVRFGHTAASAKQSKKARAKSEGGA